SHMDTDTDTHTHTSKLTLSSTPCSSKVEQACMGVVVCCGVWARVLCVYVCCSLVSLSCSYFFFSFMKLFSCPNEASFPITLNVSPFPSLPLPFSFSLSPFSLSLSPPLSLPPPSSFLS